MYDSKYKHVPTFQLKTVIDAGSKRNAWKISEALRSEDIHAYLVDDDTEDSMEAMWQFFSGDEETVIIPNFHSVSRVMSDAMSSGHDDNLPITHIVNYNLQGGMRQYRDNRARLQSRGLLTTFISSEDLAKRNLMASLRDHLQGVKQLPSFLNTEF